MPATLLPSRLLSRELGGISRYSKPRGIYGDRKWVNDLDIVNELSGHSGCVNALSWSKSGQLLASGSDDQHLNIHSYQPEHVNRPFSLDTSISTGHTANIFSVKFMPHSNDRILISAAGDSEIRVFDLEYSGRSSVPSDASNLASAGRTESFIRNGTRYLSDGDTNAKVYRSHSDRVKRLVTESSPYLFLSCSEDGEVRQWDIRQPSSSYPRPRGARAFPRGEYGDAPPPLISYKRHHLDLNTISCSPSQPHYIALGGAHLHCFLHDRRMTGRDILEERGERATSVSSSGYSDHQDEGLSQATRCVKRFAPQGQSSMKRNDNGHITACKISDANPNEMVASWSGDWIYNFDLLRSPDAREYYSTRGNGSPSVSRRVRESRDRKRKRTTGSILSQEGANRAVSKARTSRQLPQNVDEQMALRVRYENGQSENIRITNNGDAELSEPNTQASAEPEAVDRSHRIAKASVKIRTDMFTLSDAEAVTDEDPTGHSRSFTKALRRCIAILDDMDEIMRTWQYPVDPNEIDVVFQKTLRENRERSRRLVQAAGTLSRLLGGQIDPTRNGPSSSSHYTMVMPVPMEKPIRDHSEQFCYDFLKAIILWLDSGPGYLADGFAGKGSLRSHPRFPLPEKPSIDDIDDCLIPYLLDLASERPVPSVDASRFEVDGNRTIINSEKAAVLAFASAVKMPFEDLSQAVGHGSSSDAGSAVFTGVHYQDRKTALRYWGFKVARGILMNAGEGINYAFVDRAFGGLGRTTGEIRFEEQALDRQRIGVDPEDDEEPIDGIGIANGDDDVEIEEEGDDDMIAIDDIAAAVADAQDTADDSDDDGAYSGDEHEDNDEDEDDPRAFIFRNAFARSSQRTRVQSHIPSIPSQLHYRGAANVRTVKDVNFYGLQDEYVVSGSDSGHLFIWDRASGALLNILEGDGEVVNVVQGHPYEPMLAVSGIDHTVKIFSPDARARATARRGVNIAQPDRSGFSTLRWGGRTRFGTARRPGAATDGTSTSEPAGPASDDVLDSSEDDEAATAPNGLASRKRMHLEYQITSQNDVDRRGGNREAFITRSMLAQLAARMRLARRARGGGRAGDVGGDDDELVEEEGDVDADAGDGNGVDDAGVPVLDLGDGRFVVGNDCNVQ